MWSNRWRPQCGPRVIGYRGQSLQCQTAMSALSLPLESRSKLGFKGVGRKLPVSRNVLLSAASLSLKFDELRLWPLRSNNRNVQERLVRTFSGEGTLLCQSK